MFGFVMLDKNLPWFRQLLQYTIPVEEETEEYARSQQMMKRINPKQVAGTVLSLNGWRLYFCMYHPKHAPSMVGYRRPKKVVKEPGKEPCTNSNVFLNAHTGFATRMWQSACSRCTRV